jgi:hypothetical protein
MPEERAVKKLFKNTRQGRNTLENQERDGWTKLKMI